jgi:hypothetical protein
MSRPSLTDVEALMAGAGAVSNGDVASGEFTVTSAHRRADVNLWLPVHIR